MKATELLLTLPEGWRTVPIKAACYYTVSNVDKHSLEDEIPVRLCNYTDVYKNDRVSPDLELMSATATKDEIDKFRLEVGDVVITKDSESWDDIAIAAYVEGTAEDFVCGYHLAFMRPKSGLLDGRFLFRCVQSRPVALQLELEATGVTRYGLPKGAIGNALIPLPTLETQRLIADYLDRETTRIDALVTEKEKMLALLEEKRAALISRAITRGLDESAPLKPSGLDWLGDIPAHWETKKLKHVASLKSGETITADSISDTGDYPVYGGNGFRGFTSEYTHVGDYVLIGRQGALCGNINYASGQFWASEHAVVATIKLDDDVFWLGELLRFMNLNQYSQSAAQPGISVEVVENLKIPVPPVTEQVQIAAYMKKESDFIEAIREEVSKTTALLKERRAALITAAVTGQIATEDVKQN